jgi:predicted MPP superfamily phosphohydrolase
MKYRWVVFFSLLGGLLLYTGHQAQRLLPHHPTLAWTLNVGLFVLMFLWQFLARAGASRMDSKAFRAFAWAGSIALGVWATLILFWLPIDAGREILLLTRTVLTPGANFLQSFHFMRWVPVLLFMISTGLAGLGLEEALSGPHIVHIPIKISKLPRELEGLKIAHITDLHIGPMIRHGYVQRVVDQIMALKPDLIAFTGDLADGSADILAEQVKPLAGLRAPLGVYFVTGNHEYYWGAEEWLAKARTLGFTTLVNENRVVDSKGAKILVAGVTDLHAEHFIPEQRSDAQKAAATTSETQFKLLLAHRPTGYDHTEPLGFQLQLSGHTHGGQFFPFSLLIPFFYKYSRGLHKHGNLWIYVNPGTGYWGPPHRFLVPAEITLLTLQNK